MKIAIVGMAFRFPGDVGSEEALWELLTDGREALSTVDPSRWGTDVYFHPKRAEPGRSVTVSAGLLSQVDQFDAAFFGISPREARHMDPQQRLMLELTWEALENGGHVPASIAGSDCAVYVGISSSEYGLRPLDDLSSLDGYSMTGNTLSIAANRISYVFDLRGPSMAVDTACSSSLVALHQACRCLADGEAGMVIAGGVNMLLHPYPFIGFSKASMLSARGKCRAFDAGGDGYVRAEGGAILILKPLAQAEADGDPIHAVILATGTNSDGARKTGITIPSAEGQADLLRATCKKAGLVPQDIAYLEAHGTGTAVGDPIETRAIGQVLGVGRPADRPLYIGSVKTNFGHLEPASGMAGLVKTVLCLKHHGIPPSLNLETPNPNIDFAGLNLKVVTEYQPLPETGNPLRMGVNSFGFGGANAHVLLEEYPPADRPETAAVNEVPPLFLSAKSNAALRELASAYAEGLPTRAGEYYDIAYTAAYRRQRLQQGIAFSGGRVEDIAAQLRAYAAGESVDSAVSEEPLPGPAKIAFVYSGNGTQWLGMGRRLFEAESRFRRSIDEIDALLAGRVDFSIRDELWADAETSRLALTEVAQPALFAIQVAVTRLLRDHGLDADAALGHSVGEVAAAWATGALSLEQAVAVILERSSAQGLTKGSGRMAAAGMSLEQARAALAEAEVSDQIEIAAINSPSSVTLSGPLAGLELLQARLEKKGIFFRLLDLDYAFHTRSMESIREQVLGDLAGLTPARGQGHFISTVTGSELAGEELDADYWWQNIRQPVQFEKAVATLIDRGYTVFLEISPHAIMQRYLGECFAAKGVQGRALATLRRDNDASERVQEAALRACLLGCKLDLDAHFPHAGRIVALPAYPWQRERHWYQPSPEAYQLISRSRVHPLLGYRLREAEAMWENHVDTQRLPYLADHVVGGAVVFPGAGYVEMALAASAQWFGTTAHEIEELEIRAPIVLDGEHARTLRFELSPEDGSFRIKSRQRMSDDDWMVNVVGRLVGAPLCQRPEPVAIEPRGEAEVWLDAATHYRLATRLGLEYGPAFQGVAESHPVGKGVWARLAVPEAVKAGLGEHLLHPTLLDAGFQALFDIFHSEIAAGERATLLPVHVGRVRLFGDGGEISWCKAEIVRQGPRSVVAELTLFDAAGTTVAQLQGCRFRATSIVLQRQAPAALWAHGLMLKPRRAAHSPSPLPDARRLAHGTVEFFLASEGALGREAHFATTLPLFDALVGAFAYQAIRQLTGLGEAAALPEALSLGEPARPLYRWLRGILEEDGYVEHANGLWRFSSEVPPPAPEDIWLTLFAESTAYLPDLVCVGRVGRHLAALLTGAEDSAALAASLRASPSLEQMFAASPTYQGTNLAIGEVLRRLVEGWPAHERVRVLEIGGGSIEFSRRLLAVLPSEHCDYVIADDDDERLARKAVDFVDLAHVSTTNLDVATLRLDQKQAPESFDVVILNHCLHRVPDLTLALANLKGLLRANGVLLLAERQPDRPADLIFGVDPHWWHYASGSEQVVSPLQSAAAWEALLEDGGYGEVAAIVEPAAMDLESGGFLVLAKNVETGVARVNAEAGRSGAWLLLHDPEGESLALAEQLMARLQSRGQRVVLAQPGSRLRPLRAGSYSFAARSRAGFARLLTAVREELGGLDHVVHLMGVQGGEDSEHQDVLAVLATRTLSAMHLVQAMAEADKSASPRLWLVTAGGVVLSAEAELPATIARISPSEATLWGFGRVLMNEQPELRCTLIDLQFRRLDVGATAALEEELLDPDDEDEIVLCPQQRHVTRMRPTEIQPAAAAAEDTPFRLDFASPGQLKNLHWRPMVEMPLAADEIEIQPMAAGLNFRDVMYAMGLLSDEAVENGFAGPTLGMEMSGIVTRVGERVTRFAVGDAAMAFAPACFASRVVTRADSAAAKPESWSFEQAATVPTVFFTVYYALHHLAQLQPGERILIHGAAGGVGIAAIQLARHLGAEIFATAGSDEKRDFVRLLGADHVMNSRSLAYADEIMAITHGEGVDVVLNSLAGEAINRNFRVLRPFGRFLELGKRDFYENTKIGLRPFRDNITYYGIDADQLMKERPALAAKLFREMMALFLSSALRPLPYRSFPATQVIDAFRYMQASRQIGKVVVSFPQDGLPEVTLDRAVPSFRLAREATYLVTGGVGGFGLRSARWLAEQGAGNLVLLGRRGADAPEVKQAVAELEALGTRVHIRACDVTDREQLRTVVAEIDRQLPPLRGVLHAAMVLDDGLILNLDATRFNRVLAPKVLGAWNLHLLTLGRALDFFVVYSSATTFIGNPGQANYVAANTYLESLVAYRRAHGLPATSVCWGGIGDVGYLARNVQVKESLESHLGGKSLTAEQALAQLGEILARNRSGLAVMDLDWHALQRLLPAAAAPRFGELRRRAGRNGQAVEERQDIRTLIHNHSATEVLEIVRGLVAEEVAGILRLPVERLDPERSLYDIGMDSLMGVELVLGIEKRFGISLPVMALTQGPTIRRISERLTSHLLGDSGEATQPDVLQDTVAAMASQHAAEVSEEEVEATIESLRQRPAATARLIE